MERTIYTFFTVFTLLLLGGCASPNIDDVEAQLISNGSSSSNDMTNLLVQYKNKQRQIAENGTITESELRFMAFVRNEFTYYYLAQIDSYYNEAEEDLQQGTEWANTAMDLVQLGLSSAATLVGGAQTKSILSAINAGLQGAQSTVNENILKDRAIQIFTTRMNANREAYRKEIVERLKCESIEKFPIQEAILSLVDYINRGSFRYAMQQLVAEASKSPKAKEEEEKDKKKKKCQQDGKAEANVPSIPADADKTVGTNNP